MDKICYIFGAGCYGKENINTDKLKNGFIIAADGGFSYLEENNIVPNLVVGDFDSLGRIPSGFEIVRHPAAKDDTDTMLAVNEGLNRGYNKFIIYGGLGGRLDHTFANIQTLTYLASKGALGFMIGENTVITSIKNSKLVFDKSYSGTVSVFTSGSCAEGVCLKGLKYPLDNAVLTHDIPLGVSNEFLGIPAEITVKNGSLIVMWIKNLDKKLPDHYNV